MAPVDLSDTRILKELLKRHGVPARKGLGQHFLTSKMVVQKIISRAIGYAGVFEIGPGPGALTSPLSEVVDMVIALEVDPRMAKVLAESSPKAEVVEGDALEVDYSLFLNRLPAPRAVVSNLPYYITGPLLSRIAEAKADYDKAILMMQREVGIRVLAQPGSSDRGSLSVFLQAQFEIAKIADVPPGSFWPPPKVDSIVLEFVPKSTGLSPDEEDRFFPFVRSCFRQPRKTLSNNLRSMGLELGEIERTLKKAGLDARCRPADPALEQWKMIFALLTMTSQAD